MNVQSGVFGTDQLGCARARCGYEDYNPEEYAMVPPQTIAAIVRYVERGGYVGDFLTAVLSNDLREAIGRADDSNMRALKKIVQFIYNNAPGNCWGNRQAVKDWIARGGIATDNPGADPYAGVDPETDAKRV